MKTSFYIPLLALALTACSNDELTNEVLPEGKYPLIMNATGLQTAPATATRASVDGNWDNIQTVAVQVGDAVTVCAQRSTGMLAVLLAFVIPFLLILLVLVVLRAWIDNEPLTGTLALASLIPYYMILSLFKGRLKSTFRFYIKKLS